MRTGSGQQTYEWIDRWARIPDTESARAGWAHPGVVVTEAGDVITFHQGDPTVLVFDKDGNLKSSWESDFTDAHGITLVKEGDAEYLWIADNGAKRQKQLGYDYPTVRGRGQVVKTTLDGQAVMRIERPDLEIYRDDKYSPTFVAVNEERHGGNGDIWVADGYGQSYVHRYNKAGEYISSINGEEGQAGRFNTPHAIFIDRRKSEPEMYVADRTNARVQVYDPEGSFKRWFGSGFLNSPSAFVTHGDFMVIAELRARLAVTDIEDNFVAYLGANDAVPDVDGWPNNKNEKGETIPSALLETGKFNSPHGMAVDSDGNLYVAEWLIGGRYTKLAKV